MRDFGVKVKLNPVREILDQKRVVIVEDSIIRGTTSKMRIKTLRQAGAKEVHMVVVVRPIVTHVTMALTSQPGAN